MRKVADFSTPTDLKFNSNTISIEMHGYRTYWHNKNLVIQFYGASLRRSSGLEAPVRLKVSTVQRHLKDICHFCAFELSSFFTKLLQLSKLLVGCHLLFRYFISSANFSTALNLCALLSQFEALNIFAFIAFCVLWKTHFHRCQLVFIFVLSYYRI